jgi:hypothetical protein
MQVIPKLLLFKLFRLSLSNLNLQLFRHESSLPPLQVLIPLLLRKLYPQIRLQEASPLAVQVLPQNLLRRHFQHLLSPTQAPSESTIAPTSKLWCEPKKKRDHFGAYAKNRRQKTSLSRHSGATDSPRTPRAVAQRGPTITPARRLDHLWLFIDFYNSALEA